MKKTKDYSKLASECSDRGSRTYPLITMGKGGCNWWIPKRGKKEAVKICMNCKNWDTKKAKDPENDDGLQTLMRLA